MPAACTKISTVPAGRWKTASRNSSSLCSPIAPAHALRSNQLRLYFSSFAYVLIETLRALALVGTELAQAQCDTIRLKLLRIGAQIRITVRNVWIAFSEAYPYANLFQVVLARVQQIPLRC